MDIFLAKHKLSTSSSDSTATNESESGSPVKQKLQEPYSDFAKLTNFKLKQKTELCKHYIYEGKCQFGDKCSFAHGENELKFKNNISQNYKTKPCKSFFLEGFCPYGKII